MRLRPDAKEDRQKTARERQAAYNKLSPTQKLARLDETLGKDVGAVKQRAKLQHIINAKPPKQEKSKEKSDKSKEKKPQKNS